MRYDHLAVCSIDAQEFCGMFGYEAVGGPVEAVSPYFVFLVVFIGQAVQLSLLWHCLMESGIKYSNHRRFWHQLLAGADTDQVRRVM